VAGGEIGDSKMSGSMARGQVQIRYVIFVDQKDKQGVMLTAPVEDGDREYFVRGIIPALRPLSDGDYIHGPAIILHSLARYSYVVCGTDVFWCAEWDPGLIVARFSPGGAMAWTALRSPIPNFGGRKPNAKDARDYDEDAENHQYNLVFKAWDAQFDEDWRRLRGFKRADTKTGKVYRAALEHVQTLGTQVQARYLGKETFDRWAQECKRNLARWTGEGIRVRL
jgi:hypothetical protein